MIIDYLESNLSLILSLFVATDSGIYNSVAYKEGELIITKLEENGKTVSFYYDNDTGDMYITHNLEGSFSYDPDTGSLLYSVEV